MNESLWLDEATTALVSRMSLGEIFTKFLPGDFHPPLYYLFMKYWVSIFGSSEIFLRLPSVIFALLTVYVVYRLSGKIAAMLLATAPLLFYYAQEARMYSLITLLVSYLVYSFIKKKWLNFSITLALLGLTDYVALLIIPIFWIIGWRGRRKLLISHLPLVVSYLFWFPIFSKQFMSGMGVGAAWSAILGEASFKNFLLIPVKFMIGRVGFDEKWLYGVIVAGTAGLYAYLLFKARKANKIYWLWLTVPIVLGAFLSFKISILTYFRFLFVLPAFYILVALGIEATGRFKNLFLTLVLCINLLSIGYYLLTPRFHREDWRGAAGAIGGSKIVFPANSQKEALIYYGKGNQIISSDEIDKKDKEIWLSRYVWEVFDSEDTARMKIEDLGYNKTSEHNFNGVLFWKYTL